MSSEPKSEIGNHSEKPPLVTCRALLLGAVTIAGMFYYVVHVVQGLGVGSYVHSQFPMTVLMPFVVWLFVNVGLKWIWPRAALKRGELLTILVMVWVVGTLPQLGYMNYFTNALASPTYFSTSENQWAGIFFDYMPWHLFPATTSTVIDTFFHGLPEGMELPWAAWSGVLAQWLSVSLGIVVFGYCLMVLFQRQWVEHERLTYPLAQMPMDLTRGMDGPRRMPDIFRRRLFWIGFGAVFLPILYNIGTYFSPGLPRFGLYWEHYNVQFSPYYWRGLWFRVMPLVLAVVYLCPLDILGSLVVFYWLSVPKEWALRRLGYTLGSSGTSTYLVDGVWDILYLESYGAFVFIAAWSVWLGRRHLREVWRQVRNGTGERRRVVVYRWAVAGMVLSALYVIIWLVGLGMNPLLAIFGFFSMAMVLLVTAKLIAATGFAYLFPNWTFLRGGTFVTDFVGTSYLSNQSVVGFKIFSGEAFFGNIRIPAWPAMVHHLRIFSIWRQPGYVTWAVLIAFPVGFLVAAGATLQLAYEDGASVAVRAYAVGAYNHLALLLQNPTGPDAVRWGLWVLGFGEAAGIALLRARFHWFSLHPMGLAFQYTFGTWLYWFSLFLVWCIKLVLLHFGGVRAYQAGKPFFYGLAIGYVLGVGLSGLVDLAWFPADAHHVHGW